jgi:putative serine protease PepD
VTQSKTPGSGPAWRKWWPQISGAIVIGLVAGALGAMGYKELGDQPGSCDTQRVADLVQPSLVLVVPDGDGSSIGNGVIIQADGVILTNATVLAAATHPSLGVVLADGEKLAATVIGSDPASDVAILKVDRTQLPALPLSWNEPLQIGQPAVAVGSPLNRQSTLTSALLSALNRNVSAPKAGGGNTTLPDLIEVNTPISDALTGSALVTCEGRLIGLSTAIQTPAGAAASGGDSGFGYAIPVTIARRVSQELLTTAVATHPWLGLEVGQVSADAALRHRGQPGLYVQAVTAAGPASIAGLRPGDLITSFNGEPATSASLSRLFLTASVGTTVSVSYLRAGQTQQASLTLVEQPQG